MMAENRTISIIVPVYNEEIAIPSFLKAIAKVINGSDFNFEVIFIDDGSVDHTFNILSEARTSYPFIKIVKLSRNFGKEAALSAGLDQVNSDAVIPMDVDLQDPPDLIPEFIEKWLEGYDVVYAVRNDRSSDGLMKKITAGLFYRVFNYISPTPIPYNAGDYRLIDRKVLLEIRKLKEKTRFMKGLMNWPGYKSTGITFTRPERAEGDTSWNYWKLWNFALDGIISFSSIPLRLWSYVGLTISGISFLFALVIIFQYFFTDDAVAGYPSLMVAVIFFGGIQLLSIGIIGEYIGRILLEVKDRPLYVVEEILE